MKDIFWVTSVKRQSGGTSWLLSSTCIEAGQGKTQRLVQEYLLCENGWDWTRGHFLLWTTDVFGWNMNM